MQLTLPPLFLNSICDCSLCEINILRPLFQFWRTEVFPQGCKLLTTVAPFPVKPLWRRDEDSATADLFDSATQPP